MKTINFSILIILIINFQNISSFDLNAAKDALSKKISTFPVIQKFKNIMTNSRKKNSDIDKSQTEAKTSAGTDSGSGSGSLSASESKAYSKTKVKTKLSASSNAKSNSSAAARAKAFAKANTETKVKTNLGSNKAKQGGSPPGESESSPAPSPFPNRKTTTTVSPVTRPTHAYWSPSFGTTVTPSPVTPSGGSNSTSSVTAAPSSESKIVCMNCPVPCPYPIPCPCPCPAPPPSPTYIFCPATCHQPVAPPPLLPPPPPPPQVIPIIPQPVNVIPCTVINAPCSPPPPPPPPLPICNCDAGNYFCPCKRTISRSETGIGSDLPNGLSQVFIYGSHNFTYKHGAVASDHYKCSEIGKRILEKGGNAMDAAISTHLCVEIVNGHSTGLGGGGFLLGYDKKKKNFFTIDFREKLPSFFNSSKKMTQGDTILVPGVLKGLELGYKTMGKLPWKDLFQEPIEIAKKGFRMHEALAEAVSKKKDFILANLGLKEVFAPEGFILQKGHIVQRTKLAETYKKIADSGGSDILYKGELAMDIVKDIREAGGCMTLKDLKNYKAVIREPLKTSIGNLTAYGVKPPASSATVLMMLKLMSKLDWNKNFLKHKPGLFFHQMLEAMKFAYAPATFLGDPEYVNDTDKIVERMLNESVLKNILNKIDNKSHIVEYYGPYSNHPVPPFSGTSHISVVDGEGNAVSLTSSINAHFGSRLLSRRLGFIYNNELSDFTEFWPKVYNFSMDAKIPGKRPMSKVSPLIMVDKNDEVQIVIGAAGGFFIPSALASTLSYYLFLHDNITTAIARPRIHCQLFPPTVIIEDGFPSTITPLLNQYKHQFVTNDTYSASGQSHALMGVIQAVVRNKDGNLEAACDYRKGGLPSGY